MQELRNELKKETEEEMQRLREDTAQYEYYEEEMQFAEECAKEIFSEYFRKAVAQGKEDAVRLALHSTLEYYNNLYEVDE